MTRAAYLVTLGLGVLVLGTAGGARADVLYVLNGGSLLRAIDPATGAVLQRTQLTAPGQVVVGATGLGVTPGGETAYALVGLGDDCSLDPTRTVFANTTDYGCQGIGSQEECDRAFVVHWGGEPNSCTWTQSGGCEECGGCLNTCVPPPPCAGSSRTHWTGFGAEACRQLDGDAAACAGAYYSDATGTFSCFESAGQCLACDVAAQVAGACTHHGPPPAPGADGSPDVFVGNYNCWVLFDDAAACARAFQAGSTGQAMACYVATDGYCTWCDASSEVDGYCTNTCTAPPVCEGDAARSAVTLCRAHDGDPAACAHSYTTGVDGGPAACFVGGNDTCGTCERFAERQGWCLNACAPPVCTEDPARTTLLEPTADCHTLDTDPAGCEAAYFVGRCGISSCHYDAETSGCRPCTPEDPGRCENACGPFEGLDFVHTITLVTIDLPTGSAQVVGSPGDSLNQPAPDATGTVHALSWYNSCIDARGLFRLDPSDLRPALVAQLPGDGSGALAFHPGDGRLYRFAADGLFATDPATVVTMPIATDAPVWFDPRAMTWAPACSAFLVADGFDGLWRLDATTGALEQTALHMESECDEGDCAVGLVLDGTTVCPPLMFPTTTTTSTSTSTSSSTSTTTLPSELVTGRSLLLTDNPAKPKKRRLEVRSDDSAISLGGGEGSADDPVLHGGSLRVVATSGSFAATYPLADGWRYVRKGGRLRGYQWAGDGAVRKVVLRPGRLDLRGQGTGLVQTLLTDPGDVRVVLQLGSRRWCLEFGGTSDVRTPRKLSARDAAAPLVCAGP